MAKPQPGVWGIDLGQCALKALRLEQIDGQLVATAFDFVEYPKILSQPDADPDQLIREALEQFLSRNTLRGDLVSISVPGQSGLARFVKLPPVEEKKIADIVRFEAKQQIPFNLDEVVWDYQKLGEGQVVDGFALETEIGLFAMKRDIIKRYLDHFKEVGVEIHYIQMAPLALCNFVAYDLLDPSVSAEAGQCVVVLDIGTDSSNLVVTDGGKIIWQRPIPLGGNHFTRALTKELKLTFAKAEHLKRNATKSPPEFKKMVVALKPVFNDFVGEVQRSLGYFNNTHRDASIAYVLGLGNAFRLPVLQKFLQEKLGMEVRKLEKMQRLAGDALSGGIYTDNVLSFGVAYGLALQGLGTGKVTTNLLPGELRTERLIRAKKPWAVAAAALLMVGLGAALADQYLGERPYANDQVAAARKASEKVISDARGLETAFQSARTNAIKEEEAVKAIVAGQDERQNWIKLVRFVTDCIPQPDGKNLPPEAVEGYWLKPRPTGRRNDAIGGQEAYSLYLQRQQAGKAGNEAGTEGDTLPRGIDDLIQYHVEHLDARFCDDLKSYWLQARRSGGDAGYVRPIEHYDKVLPEGQGWVVELQGYTYHRGRDSFIRDTLLTNIARLGITKPVVPATPGGAPGVPPVGVAPPPRPGVPAAPGVPGGAKADAKEEEEAVKEPIRNRVSHALLYLSQAKPAVENDAFEIIGASSLDTLIHAGAATGGPGLPFVPGAPATPPPPGAAPGPPGAAGGASAAPTRDSWISQSSRGGGGAKGGAGGPGAPGVPGIPGVGPGAARPRPQPGTPPGTTVPGTVRPAAPPHTRTEFVILFIWKEPTPSDKLRESASGPGAPGAPGAPVRPALPGLPGR